MSSRKEEAFNRRQLANQVAKNRPHPVHKSNEEEQKFRTPNSGDSTYLMSFTKGLPHDRETGLIQEADHFRLFVKAIDSGDFRDFRDTPLGNPDNCLGVQCSNFELGWASQRARFGRTYTDEEIENLTTEERDQLNETLGPVNVRAWESQSAGNAFDLEGPDAQAVTMPPAPVLGSPELTGEMGEVYVQALLRDVPFNSMSKGVTGLGDGVSINSVSRASILRGIMRTETSGVNFVRENANFLNELEWFNGTPLQLNVQEAIRRRNYRQTAANIARGILPGDNVGPYLSQFLLAGNRGFNNEMSPSEGRIKYGAITIDQRVRVASIARDYMTDWDEWLDVQNGADLRGMDSFDNNPEYRFIHTPRDLATYVHFDALYEAYLNACLILLSNNVPFDPGIPFQQPDNRDHQQGFAHFGGPHILSLVTEVATRALKAVRFQKYNIHRRCRPEVLAARIHQTDQLSEIAPELSTIREQLNNSRILQRIGETNRNPNNYLLPMAFPEGSPMHPAYGAGHATVAGACVTILKAFFDHKRPLNIVPMGELPTDTRNFLQQIAPGINIESSNLAYVSVNNRDFDGRGETSLQVVPVLDAESRPTKLTVEGELNKLASNISIGRNWAGVHYFTDYYESVLMGEQIALGILEEQKLMFNEPFSMTIPLFNGETIRI